MSVNVKNVRFYSFVAIEFRFGIPHTVVIQLELAFATDMRFSLFVQTVACFMYKFVPIVMLL